MPKAPGTLSEQEMGQSSTPAPGLLFSYKVPVIKTDDYIVHVQMLNLNGTMYPFVHCDVLKWSKEIKNSLMDNWTTFRHLANTKFLALNDTEDAKHRKFLSLFGFQFLAPLECDDGVERNLYISN